MVFETGARSRALFVRLVGCMAHVLLVACEGLSSFMCLTCGFRRLPHVPCLCVFLVGGVCGSRLAHVLLVARARAWVFLSCVSRVTSVGVWLSTSVSRAVRLMFTPTAPFHPATCHSSIFTSTASRALRIKPLAIRDLLEVLLQK